MNCPDCGSKKLERNSDGLVCKKCGLVVEEKSFFSGRAMLV